MTWRGARIMFFPDYSQRVNNKRKAFQHVKADLRKRGVYFALCFPATLEIKLNGAKHRFETPEEVSEFIQRRMAKD